MYWCENIYIDEYEIMPQYLMSLGLNPDWQLLFTAIPENICAALKTFDSAFSLRHVQMLTALQTRDLYQIKGKKYLQYIFSGLMHCFTEFLHSLKLTFYSTLTPLSYTELR